MITFSVGVAVVADRSMMSARAAGYRIGANLPESMAVEATQGAPASWDPSCAGIYAGAAIPVIRTLCSAQVGQGSPREGLLQGQRELSWYQRAHVHVMQHLQKGHVAQAHVLTAAHTTQQETLAQHCVGMRSDEKSSPCVQENSHPIASEINPEVS